MAVSFTKDEKNDLAVVTGKLEAARKENAVLRADLNNALNVGADSTAAKEKDRADTAEATLVQRDRQLAETTAALKQASADSDRLTAQAARVQVVLEKGFDEIVKQLSA